MRLVLVLLAGLLTAPALACGGAEDACVAGEGRYHLAEPPGWDGEETLPVMVFLHGYNSSGAAYRRNKGFVKAWTDAGFLLVLPSGSGKSWAHNGSPKPGDDLPFVLSVLDDVAARYPVSVPWLSGFSQGGSMVWEMACRAPERFAGFFPVAGAFWNPLPDSCAGPVALRHIHGTADTVVPMTGREIGGGRWRQGDVLASLGILRAVNGCAAAPDGSYTAGRQTCEVWSSCDAGHIELCRHPGKHGTPRGWIAEAIRVIRAGWAHP